MLGSDKKIIVDTGPFEFTIYSPGLTRDPGTVSFSTVRNNQTYVRLGQGDKLFGDLLKNGPSKGEYSYLKPITSITFEKK